MQIAFVVGNRRNLGRPDTGLYYSIALNGERRLTERSGTWQAWFERGKADSKGVRMVDSGSRCAGFLGRGGEFPGYQCMDMTRSKQVVAWVYLGK